MDGHDDHVELYVVIVELHGVSRLGTVKIDHSLVAVLVQRWRQSLTPSTF